MRNEKDERYRFRRSFEEWLTFHVHYAISERGNAYLKKQPKKLKQIEPQ